MTANIVKNNGVTSLYNGLSAALLRQGTYSTARFAFYEYFKHYLLTKQQKNDAKLSFYQKMLIAGAGGGIGSIFGRFKFLKIQEITGPKFNLL